MKVLQIVPSISLVYGGPSQMVLGLSKALADWGVDVTILTTDSNGDVGQPPLEVPLGQPILENGYKILYFRCFPWHRYKFSLTLLNWLTIHAKTYDIAHIHALFSPVSTAAATIARIQKLPYILRPLGTLDPADLQKKRQLKRIYGLLLEKPNIAGAAAVHFTSEQECKISERFGVKTRDLVIPLGVDLPEISVKKGQVRQQLGIKEDIPLILFMSRIDPKKGLDLLFPALENLLKMGRVFHFVLAGSNPQDPVYENQIKERIQTSQLNQYTTIAGFVAGEMKLALLTQADLFVLPSYYENFGIAVAEAMAMGTPVVISDRVYIWDTVEKASAGWVTSCTVEGLTQALKIALQNSDILPQKGLNAQKLAQEKYSWNAIAQSLLTVYQQLIKIDNDSD